MASSNYTQKIRDGEDVYFDLPRNVILPKDPSLYMTLPWLPKYTWSKLSYLIYGDTDKLYLLLAANDLTNPFEKPDTFRFLLPEYLKRIRFA